MHSRCVIGAVLCFRCSTWTVAAQTPPPPPPPKEPPPLWDAEVGFSYVGTNGNTDTSSLGAAFAAHRRWPLWQIEAAATAVNTTDNGTTTAARYLGSFRAQRKLTDRLGVSTGIRLERDHLSGIDFRSILDGGLTYKLIRRPYWTLDSLTGLGWDHEARVVPPDEDDFQAVLQALSKFLLGTAGETTQRFTFYPDFTNSTAYRSEAEVTVQAAMNKRLALKFGFLWRYSHEPVPGFKRSDTTTTASLVVRWRAATPAPAP